jgi:hypothetical protein
MFDFIYFVECLLLQWKLIDWIDVKDDLDFGVKDVAFETNVLDMYGNFRSNCKCDHGRRSILCVFALWFVN